MTIKGASLIVMKISVQVKVPRSNRYSHQRKTKKYLFNSVLISIHFRQKLNIHANEEQ